MQATVMTLGASFTGEIWRDAPGVIDYEVSSFGRVRHCDRRRIRRPQIDCNGYRILTTDAANYNPSTFKIARLVCWAFNGPPPEGKPEVDHKDRDRSMDHFENLRWVDRIDNMMNASYAYGEQSGHAKLTDQAVLEIRASTLSAPKLAAQYGVAAKTVRDARTRVTWKHLP